MRDKLVSQVVLRAHYSPAASLRQTRGYVCPASVRRGPTRLASAVRPRPTWFRWTAPVPQSRGCVPYSCSRQARLPCRYRAPCCWRSGRCGAVALVVGLSLALSETMPLPVFRSWPPPTRANRVSRDVRAP